MLHELFLVLLKRECCCEDSVGVGEKSKSVLTGSDFYFPGNTSLRNVPHPTCSEFYLTIY